MRKVTTIYGYMLPAFTTLVFFSIVIAGCNKEYQKNSNHDQIIEEYKLALFKDKDFIDNYRLDRVITKLNKNINLVIDENKTNSLVEILKVSKSKEELSHAFASFGYRNPFELVALFDSKATALINVKQKFPYLTQLTKQELNKMFYIPTKELT